MGLKDESPETHGLFRDAPANKEMILFSLGNEVFVAFCLSLAAIAVPFAFHSNALPNQLFVGTFVNALLASSALYLPFRKSLPVILLPSVAAVASGIVFGGFSALVAMLVPAIWLGNGVFVLLIKRLKILGGTNYGLAVLVSSFCKAAIIGLFTFVLFILGLVPQALLVPMSVVQFATAMMGGLLAGTTLLLKK
ncbi:Uncharacterised protein [uncultured archaeon]|nr:Uncharacterised protein [uncultured archaeon]